MNRREAEAVAARLSRRHTDRSRYQWFVRQDPEGEWVVVKAGVPSAERARLLKATIQVASKPPQPEDPRPVLWKDVGGPYAA